MVKKKAGTLKVKIWGARGSLPVPLMPATLEKHIRDLFGEYFIWMTQTKGKSDIEMFFAERPRHSFGGYGGNTPCIEVKSTQQQIIIDGGSGIRSLGYELMEGPCGKGAGEVHILFTHFHWDHLIGLPFFPVPLENLGSTIEYHQLEPRKPARFGDINVTPYQLDHPDPCWGFKIENGGKVFSHCVDTECTRVTREELGPDLPLYQGVDTMIFDAQYTLMETIERVNWGHATASLGLDIAMREGVRRMVFMHHDPASSNEKIAAAENQAKRYYKTQLKHAQEVDSALHEVDWTYGYEGMVLDV
jgi:phosphoribosyl 1,2-cyclic phosphodiesterase